MFLPAAALRSPGQSAHSAACGNASCPSPEAARKNRDANFSYANLPLHSLSSFISRTKRPHKNSSGLKPGVGALDEAPLRAGPACMDQTLSS